MKVGVISDVHIGNHGGGPMDAGINKRCHLALETLAGAVDVALQEECSDLYILGDLFHTAKPSPQIIAATQEVLTDRSIDLNIWITVGNHDQTSATAGDHALGPLLYSGHLAPIDSPRVVSAGGCRGLLVPYTPRGLWKVLKKEIEENAPLSFLGIHAGLVFGEEPDYLRGPDTVDAGKLAALCKEHGIQYVLAGHWHRHTSRMIQGVYLAQVGALCPTGYGDHGLIQFGKLAIWDTDEDSIVWKDIPGPRFIKVSSYEEGLRKAPNLLHEIEAGNRVFLRWTVTQENLESAQQSMAIWPLWGEVLLDSTEASVASRSAAQEAKSAKTLEEALDGYVAALELPEGVDHSWVFYRCREYLKGGLQ